MKNCKCRNILFFGCFLAAAVFFSCTCAADENVSAPFSSGSEGPTGTVVTAISPGTVAISAPVRGRVSVISSVLDVFNSRRPGFVFIVR
jgi:hypothetical protein